MSDDIIDDEGNVRSAGEDENRPQPRPHITVDRGQPIIVTVTFAAGDPDAVYFSYMRPGSGHPHVDDGFGEADSLIERLDRGVYRYVISTRGYDSGDGAWHFWGEWAEPSGHRPYTEASVFGTYTIAPAPAQLL